MALLACGWSVTGCVTSSSDAAPLDPHAFVEAREKLAELRKAAGAARTESIRLELDAPYLQSEVAARGAIAVRPATGSEPPALRMIMVGPGGTTAMDLWMKAGKFRFEIPAIGKTLTGLPSNRPETRKGLPVDFLKWWMFEPLGGKLLAARRVGADLEVLLDEPGRTTTATIKKDGSISAHRRWVAPGARGRFVPYEEEWLEASGIGCARAVYRQKSTSLTVKVTCLSSKPTVNDAAFEEPSGAGDVERSETGRGGSHEALFAGGERGKTEPNEGEGS
ncbi:MAG: hypothetical protein HOW73_16380 [Polyangiaceae bacterium]|nr:hypothetical protein [Polyangiaceae bacterium]